MSLGQVLSNPFETKSVAAAPATENPFAPSPVVEPESAIVVIADAEPVITPPETQADPQLAAAEHATFAKEASNPFAAELEEPPPRPKKPMEPPVPVKTPEPERSKVAFAFEKLPVKPAAEKAPVPVPERAIGELYEESAWEVNKVNPFKEQRTKIEVPYNPFAPNALKAAVVTVPAPAASTSGRPAPPPPGSQLPKKVNKNRPPPSREGTLKLGEGKGPFVDLTCIPLCNYSHCLHPTRSVKAEKRFFELATSGHLHYYKKQGSGKPTGSFFLKGNPVRPDDDKCGIIVQSGM